MKINKRRIEQMSQRKLLRIMRRRYPHLHEAHHLDRWYAAQHEAGHFFVGVLLKTFVGQNANIAVPGRFSSWKRHPDSSGAVECFSYDQRENALVGLAGILASLKSEDPGAEEVTQRDWYEFRLGTSDLDAYQLRTLQKEAVGLVDQNWPKIQKLAIAMLLLADEDGDIQGLRFLALWGYASDLAGHAEQAAALAALVRGSPILVVDRGAVPALG
jgi:hypothetical protein